MKSHLHRLMQHAGWANRRVLDVLNRETVPAPQVLLTFAPVLTTEHIYLERVCGRDPRPQYLWPQLSLAECTTLAAENQMQYENFLDALAEAELDCEVKYRNRKSFEFHTPSKDLLTQVALHGAYHRSQIAAALRANSREPVNTDFIAFVREGR